MNRRQYLSLGIAAAVTSVVEGYGLKTLPSDIRVTRGDGQNQNQDQSTNKDTHSNTLFGAFDDQQGQHYASRVIMNDAFLSSSKHASLQHDSKKLDSRSYDSSLIDSMAIPFRAHDTLPLSAQKSLSFGRRPNNQMIACDFESRQQRVIEANEGRHFYGHGCIHHNRNTLFTTENDYENAKGIIGLRDSKTFEQIGEYSSFGVGPHDIHLMPDNKTLVIANGGIQTHPDFGRRKLNIKTMQPSLVFVDIDTGKKVDEYRLDNPKLSIRHLSITPEGGVGIATQYQYESGYQSRGKVQASVQSKTQLSQEVPNYLLAWLGNDGLQTLNDSQKFTEQCKGYIGDVALDTSGQILAATSPRGNNVSLWDIKQSGLIKTIQIASPCGLYFDKQNQEFLVSNEKGNIYKISLNDQIFSNSTHSSISNLTAKKWKGFSVKWDNHMMILS